MNRRGFLTKSTSSALALATGMLSAGQANALVAGSLKVAIKDLDDSAHVSLYANLNWAGIFVTNKPLASLTVRSDEKAVSKVTGLPGGTAAVEMSLRGTKLKARLRITSFTGHRLDKTWDLVSADGTVTLPIIV